MRVMVLVVFAMALLLWASMGSSHAAAAHDEAPPPWAQRHLRRLLARHHHKADAVVVPGGGGGNRYRTIAEALAAAPPPPGRYVVHIRAGIYSEAVNITRAQVTLIGDGMGRTVLTGNQSSSTGHDMLNSAILTVKGNEFMARDITIRNTAGVSAGPAVALMSLSDKSVYYRCELDGFQDTLNADCNRQFYHSCRIMGTVDFIFGYAKAIFQECQVLVRRSVEGKDNVITAQGRDGPDDLSGFVFQRCTVKALQGDNLLGTNTFLGRPWKKHSRVVFMRCMLDGIIAPPGWEQWNATTPVPNTVYYGEYQNNGPGARTQDRVSWKEFHILNAAEATKFTVNNFIQGDDWLPGFGITYKQE